ncbi:glutathione-disulfide reductase [Carnobacteriaceae bacterium zg-ZUI78]|nr:glutathione-disulfide reductase [Carnobacteriaceae bacterium zg-ZUI78]
MHKVDYIVIGGGSGGIASANRAAMYGARVVVIEQSHLGGTCVNLGCVPKKIMWYGAQVADTLNLYAKGYGFTVDNTFRFETLLKNRDAYIERSRASYTRTFDKNGVQVIDGLASFIDNHTVEVNGEFYTAPHILIATGGKPSVPDVEGVELGETSDDFFGWTTLPKSVAVVGAGYIAVELAGVLNSLGVKVDLLVRGDKPLRYFDDMLSDTLVSEMEKSGIVLHKHAITKSLHRRLDGLLTLTTRTGQAIDVERVIWATGRTSNTHKLGLENTDIVVDELGFIKTDDYQNTTVSGVYSVGDVTGRPALTPVAIAAGRRLSERLFNGKTNEKLDYHLIPTVIFSHPAIGSVGLTEKQAIDEFGKEEIKVYTAEFASMYTAVTDHRQVVKMKLITQGEHEKIVGLHGIGYGVDEMIQGFAVAMKMGATKKDFDNTIAIHPTGSEEFVTMR